MTFRALEIFLAVADEKSFGKAAQKLFISQPSVTQQIKKLESELGFTLLHRDRHTVELTEAGVIIHDAARSILSTYHQALMNSMKCIAAEEPLNIGYVGQMNEHLLPEIIISFQESHPQQNILTTRLLPLSGRRVSGAANASHGYDAVRSCREQSANPFLPFIL